MDLQALTTHNTAFEVMESTVHAKQQNSWQE